MKATEREGIISDFEQVSIRGRYGYGMLCLELAFEHRGLTQLPSARTYLDQLWDYTSTGNLAEWHKKMEVIRPDAIAYSRYHLQNGALQTFTETEISQYYTLIRKLPGWFWLMMENIIAIGERYLYGAIPEMGSESLLSLAQILKIMEHHHLKFPDPTKCMQYKFKDAGWGKSFSRAEVQ